MSFFLFLLVNATLFIRPAEIVPALLGWRIYEALILLCLLAALPEVLAWLSGRSLESQPVTLCVLGLAAAAVISHLAPMRTEEALAAGEEFVKLLVYYVLLVSVINTPGRMRAFLHAVAVFCIAMTVVAVLRYHDVIEIDLPPPPRALKPGEKEEVKQRAFMEDRVRDVQTGEEQVIHRMIGTGIFWDPNDLCFALVIGTVLCTFWLTDPRAGPARVLLLAPIGLFGYALYLTQSRGGLLAFLAALTALFWSRYGWRRGLALLAAAAPVVLILYGGRMTGLLSGASEGTGQSRIQLWSDGLDMFREAPLFGVGMYQYTAHSSHVAHNSFLHAYAELGLVGGTLFLGAFYFAWLSLWRARPVDYETWRLRPYLLALLVGSGASMLTLSLCYIVPTYMVLGLATVFSGLAARPAAVPQQPARPSPVLRLDAALGGRLVLASFGFLLATYLFVRVFRA